MAGRRTIWSKLPPELCASAAAFYHFSPDRGLRVVGARFGLGLSSMRRVVAAYPRQHPAVRSAAALWGLLPPLPALTAPDGDETQHPRPRGLDLSDIGR